ncbi:hypothetical protein JTB14_015854 [Gonioctena quinquepunctata]|nr:hypothetical protein JTB14_015854 [Gonioctena quinquepunctata]
MRDLWKSGNNHMFNPVPLLPAVVTNNIPSTLIKQIAVMLASDIKAGSSLPAYFTKNCSVVKFESSFVELSVFTLFEPLRDINGPVRILGVICIHISYGEMEVRDVIIGGVVDARLGPSKLSYGSPLYRTDSIMMIRRAHRFMIKGKNLFSPGISTYAYELVGSEAPD